MREIQGGVCAAKGFLAGATHCGVRKSQSKLDMAVIYSQELCSAAAVYTKNRVKADCIKVTRDHLQDGKAQAIICNSGNANACAPNGKENAEREAKACANLVQVPVEDVIVCSTGVIGQELPVSLIEEGVKNIELSDQGGHDAAIAIMTTDTHSKECAVAFEIDGKTCHLGGMCKGSGMIHPNMGTMLAFITTDANISSELLQEVLLEVTQQTFNRISVDGDTSTNDTCVVLANGLAQNESIKKDSQNLAIFKEALHKVMEYLAIQIASDGEGASRLLTVKVQEADTEAQAETLAKSIVSSSLLKAAMFGTDANWGRVLCAMGYAGVDFDPDSVDVSFSSKQGSIHVCSMGKALDFDEDLAKKILQEDSIEILVSLHQGQESVTCWGCDLTYDYVKINGDYRT